MRLGSYGICVPELGIGTDILGTLGTKTNIAWTVSGQKFLGQQNSEIVQAAAKAESVQTHRKSFLS